MDDSLSYFFCRLSPSKPIIFRGHNDGVSSFSMWGQDVISISRNKIGLSSLTKSADEVSRFALGANKSRISLNNIYSLSCTIVSLSFKFGKRK